jgi:type IV secretion system protein VirD4
MKSAERRNGTSEQYATGGHAVGLADDRHIITVAGSRAGKGRSAIVPNMMLYTGSIMATDPKGELASITAEHRNRHLGQNVYVLDPFGVAKVPDQYRASFNPLSILSPDSPTLVEDAGLIADALVISSSKDEHWDASAREVITALMLYLSLRDLPATCTLPEMRRILRNDILLEARMELIASGDELDGVLAGLAQSYLSKPDSERGSVLSNARRQTTFLDFNAIQGVLSGHDFDLGSLKTDRTTVYLCLPAMRMGTCNRWLRLFINLVLAAMENPNVPPPEPPVLLCLDEFATLGHMQTIENAAGQIAGFGVKLWPIIQDLGQLETLYEKRWQTFMANAGVLQFFGNSDLTTLEWISKRLGSTTIRVASKGEVGFKQAAVEGKTGESWANDVRPLLAVDEIAKIFSRDDPLCRQLVIWAGRDPMILQRAYYDKHEVFAP